MLVVMAFLMLAAPAMVLLFPSLLSGSQCISPESGLKATIMGTGNPPQFVAAPLDPTEGGWNETFVFDAFVSDQDNDALNVTWDWGDGTPIGVNHTGPAKAGLLIENVHVYSPNVSGRGDFNYILYMNLSIDDGNGNNVTVMTTVIVEPPPNASPVAPSVKIPLYKVDPTDTVVVYTNTTDPEGDPLTWTYIFSNSVPDFLTIVNHTPQTPPNQVAWSNISVVFGAVGNYTIEIFVSDTIVPYQLFPHNVSRKVGPIYVAYNQKPSATKTITVDPPSPVINATIGYVNVDYKIDVADPDGDVVTATWNFGDGTANVTDVTGGGTGRYTLVQVRNYTDPGSFNVSVSVTDGRPGHETVLTTYVTVNSTNRPPSVVIFEPTYVQGASALPNETVNFTLVIMEPEKDNVFVVIDFGDGSERLYLNLTEFVDKNVSAQFSHFYTKVGNYTVWMWYTDNKTGVFNHSKQYNLTVKVSIPFVVPPNNWSWWDYTSLGLFCVIPVPIAVQFLLIRRKRKALEEEGMSLEEWKLIKSIEKQKAKPGGP